MGGRNQATGESQMKARLGKILGWCALAIALICEIAAVTVLAAIFTNKLSDYSEAWMAVWFFAVFAGIAWIIGATSTR